MNNAICEFGNAKAVTTTEAYIAPEAPRLGRISGIDLLATVEVAVPVVAETADAQVSIFFVLFA